MNKKILIFLILPFFGCALTIISPGINSNYRLNKTASIRFQEAAFYGSTFYDHSAFFLEYENLKEIIKDPNNATFNKGDILQINQFNKNNVNLLYEFCFDKEKDIDIFEDIKYYQFKLNENPPISIVSYFYPYSYFYRGGFVRKNRPYYINDVHPYNEYILKTGNDFQMCIRNIISFDTNSQKNKNILEILTPRNLTINFTYDFDKKFVLYKNEEMEFSAK
ncbi:hypothetical protein [Leptospira terpstrae]|uniref:Uncharacterized protein n=1 Tax=Leptospira terpstrae serovar Hualin str. LT 11-33 = ATCC 700639 TaxID=1257025 RepID=N1VYT9_9LEPT|nr:hypothetical protein [Leptospira terpstrae]EMY60591.1 hypothetical protein LEP1GSC203_0368 [Leptospira terpstrae serovar Hualin str. LT 11-33 = ATCC 700639]